MSVYFFTCETGTDEKSTNKKIGKKGINKKITFAKDKRTYNDTRHITHIINDAIKRV